MERNWDTARMGSRQDKMKNRNWKMFFVFVFCLGALKFFVPIFIPNNFQYYIYYVLLLIATIIVAYNINSLKKDIYSTPFLLIITSIIISAFCATVFWSQGLYQSVIAILFYLCYMLYFMLMALKIEVRDIEKIIPLLGVIFAILYVISFVTYPNSIFGGIFATKYGEERGFLRILMPGIGFLFLFSFYSLGHYKTSKKIWWIVVFIITLGLILATLTRTLIAASFLVLTLFLLRQSKVIVKLIAICIVFSTVYIVTQMEFFKILTEITIHQVQNIESELRYQSARFYLTEFSPNLATKILGNGPAGNNSWYGMYVNYVSFKLGYFREDLGFLGFYINFGFLALFAYFAFMYRTIKVSIPEEYMYAKYFLYFAFLATLTVDVPFNPSWILSVVIAAYILSAKNRLSQPVETI